MTGVLVRFWKIVNPIVLLRHTIGFTIYYLFLFLEPVKPYFIRVWSHFFNEKKLEKKHKKAKKIACRLADLTGFKELGKDLAIFKL